MKRARVGVARLLFALARTRLGGAVAGWSFAHVASLLPVDTVCETERAVAFYHPRPSYPVHIVVIPKRVVPGFAAITAADLPYVNECIAVAQWLVRELELEAAGYRFLVNGGPCQDVRQLHFHLVSGLAQPLG